MKEYLNVEVLANVVSLLRADIEGAIWISDRADEALFYEGCAHPSSRVLAAHGLAMQVFSVVQHRGIKGVVATVSNDSTTSGPGIFRPELGDVASLLLSSEAAARVLVSLAGMSWIRASEKKVGCVVRQAVHIARVVSQVCKTLKESGNDNFSLKFLLGEVVDWQEFEFNWDYLVDVLEEQAIKADFVREIQSGCTCTNLRTDLSLSDGSCAIETLAFALQRFHPRGIQASTQVDGNMLLAQLRAAFDLSSLETDRMYWEMRTWQRKFRYALLKQWRTLDPLNVVLDQRYWEQDLKALVSLMNPDNVLVAFKLDLDNFKDVNTQLGHSGGDEAIRVYCQTVLDTIGDVAEVYRRGGDEVVAFAPDLTPEHGIVLAEQLRCSIERNLGHWGKSKGLVSPPTASIGVLAISGDQPIPTITSALDAVQQRAKDEGKNRFTFESIGRLAPS